MRLQTSAARRAPVSALALLALLSPGVGAQCAGQTYALNAPSAAACAPCAPGATFVSQTASCAPSPGENQGPVDTAFYLSGSQAEGVAALTVQAGGAPLFVPDNRGRAGAALSLSGGATFATPPFAAAPGFLRGAADAGATAAALVQCSPASLPAGAQGAVLEWGAADAAGAATKLGLLVAPGGDTRMYLASPTGQGPVAGAALAVVAGSGASAEVDGVGTSASVQSPLNLAWFTNGSLIVTDYSTHRTRMITNVAPGQGVVVNFLGTGVNTPNLNGPLATATINNPIGVAVDPVSGDVFVAEFNSPRIRRVTGVGTPNGLGVATATGATT